MDIREYRRLQGEDFPEFERLITGLCLYNANR